MTEYGDETKGISRRSLLTKGAVAGGVVWVAPVVLSAPAGAAELSGGGGGCTTTARVYAKWTPGTAACYVGATGSGTWVIVPPNAAAVPCVTCDDRTAISAEVSACIVASLPQPTVTSCKDTEYLGVTFDFTPSATSGIADVTLVLDGEISAGSDCTDIDDPSGLVVALENTEILNPRGIPKGISHVDFCLEVCIDGCVTV